MLTSASTSSMKTTEGARMRAMLKTARTIFSLSPRYLLISEDEVRLKKVDGKSEHTALASRSNKC